MEGPFDNQQKPRVPEHALGPVLVTCQPTSLLDWYRQIAPTTPAYVTLVGNLVASVFFALMGGMAAVVLDQVWPLGKPWTLVLFILIAAALFPLCLWGFFIAPLKDYLILHERGFRYRLNGSYPGGQFAFSDIKSLSIGEEIEGSWIEKTVNVIRPSAGGVLGHLRKNALQVTRMSGKVERIEYLLVRFDAKDTAKFLTCLLEKHADLTGGNRGADAGNP